VHKITTQKKRVIHPLMNERHYNVINVIIQKSQ